MLYDKCDKELSSVAAWLFVGLILCFCCCPLSPEVRLLASTPL
jgi:hypothetical protein